MRQSCDQRGLEEERVDRKLQESGSIVAVHIDAEGRAIPYCGYVFIGTSYEMPAFAVDSIVEWWCRVDRERNAEARELLILADCGGANGYRSRVWKYRLYRQLCEPSNLQRPDEE